MTWNPSVDEMLYWFINQFQTMVCRTKRKYPNYCMIGFDQHLVTLHLMLSLVLNQWSPAEMTLLQYHCSKGLKGLRVLTKTIKHVDTHTPTHTVVFVVLADGITLSTTQTLSLILVRRSEIICLALELQRSLNTSVVCGGCVRGQKGWGVCRGVGRLDVLHITTLRCEGLLDGNASQN